MPTYEPEKISIVAATNNPALGRATEIMFKSMGFARVEITTTDKLCQRASEVHPTFIIFTPEYLSMPVEDMITCGCPCKSKAGCISSLTIIFLRKKTTDRILMSKQMGFDGIIFADQSMERLHEALQTVYETKS